MSRTRRVVIPFVQGQLCPEADMSVHQQGGTPRLLRIDNGDPTAYARLLTQLWGEAGDLMLLGQSVILPRDALQRFHDCDRPWCVHQVEIRGQLQSETLGCTRFTAALKRQTAMLPVQVLMPNANGSTWPNLHQVAGRVISALRERGYASHLHQPPTRSVTRGEVIPRPVGAN